MNRALPGARPHGRPGHGASAAAVSGLAGRAVTVLRAPRRLTWAVELDIPVGLTPGQAPGADWAMVIEEAATPGSSGPALGAPARGWLVLITLINTGPTPVSGEDFREPLAFRFPGREARAARAAPAPVAADPGRQAPAPPPALCDPDGDSVTLTSGLLLGKGHALTLTAVLRGTPALGLPPVSQRGSLPGWTITAVPPDTLA